MSDKIGLIQHLLSKLDQILLGGGMAYTFLTAQGVNVGNSVVEAEKLDAAREILAKPKSLGVTIRLPDDHVIAQRLETSAPA